MSGVFEGSYKFIWTQYVRIYLRKDENNPVVSISNQGDLDRIQRRTENSS